MMQVIQMTDKEKLKMYMKCNKKELAKMLIQCNKLIETNILPQITVQEMPLIRDSINKQITTNTHGAL